jgi:hypothetical protein
VPKHSGKSADRDTSRGVVDGHLNSIAYWRVRGAVSQPFVLFLVRWLLSVPQHRPPDLVWQLELGVSSDEIAQGLTERSIRKSMSQSHEAQYLVNRHGRVP